MSILTVTRPKRITRNTVARDTDVPRDTSGDGQVIPFLPWPKFDAQFEWWQGEHVAAIAGTQSGKTTLIRAILPRRQYVASLITKRRDAVISEMKREGFVVQREWEPCPTAWPKVLLWPDLPDAEHMWIQRKVFKACLDNIFRSGGWTLHANEVRYITQNLNLKEQMELIWLQGASADSTIVGETQRPAWVPLEFYNASTHIFLWSENDHRNLKRLSELDGANTDLIRWQVPRLREYEALYVCTRKRAQGLQMARTIAPIGR